MKKSIAGAAVAAALIGGVIMGGQTTITGQAYHQSSEVGVHNSIYASHGVGHHVAALNADELQTKVQAQIDADKAAAAAAAAKKTASVSNSCGYCGNSSCQGQCKNTTSSGTHHTSSKTHHTSSRHHNSISEHHNSGSYHSRSHR